MTEVRRARGRLRAGGLLLGTLLATLVAWSPAVVQPVLAAGPLGVRAETVYTIDPEAGRVHVAIEYTVTNNKPSTATVDYYYRELTFGIQPDVRQVRASDRSGSLAVSTQSHDAFTEVEVRLRTDLYYGRSSTFTLRYDLVGGAPRSDTPTRVGAAFATFGVWAFGDSGSGSVEVRIPPGFTWTVDGDELPVVSGGVGSGAVLRTAPADPDAFFAIVSADNRARYEATRISLPGGIEIVVLSWPEDDAWRESVTRTMRTGIPILQDLLGLDWPVFRDLNVQERYTPALEGYAGIFFGESQRIDMSEDLDPVTTLHEASHAWFNETLFAERWITEGLAEDYADRVHAATGGDPPDPPVPPDPEDPGFVRLNEWVFPAIVRDDTDDKEIYGYGAAAWLVHEIVTTAGVERMREAFRSADANLTAYPGVGEPEHVGIRDTWRRFLDLTQPIDQPDPEAIIEALRDFVVAPGDERALAQRGDARDAYRALLDAGDGWLPPWYVRQPMGEWRFEDATARIGEATAVLALRDRVEAAAAAARLELDEDLRAAYEGAQDGLDAATGLARRQLEAITAIEVAGAKVEAEPDLIAQIGLLGATPRVPYDAARAAFDGGDLDGALAQAGVAAALIDRAPAAGQERVVMGSIVGVALVVMVGVIVVLRRRRREAVAAPTMTGPELRALDSRLVPEARPAAPEPSATLLADPEAPSSPLGEGPPDGDGGPTRP